MESQAPFERTTVVKSTALLLGWTILIGLGLRALIAREIEPVATLIGVFFALMLFAVRRRIAGGAPAEAGAMTVVAVAVAVYTALSWTSDGFRGSIILAAPMVPLITGLMLGKRACRNVTVLMALILMFILTQHLTGTMQVDENFPEEIRYAMRAIILLLSLVAVNWVTSYYTTLSVVPPETGSVVETQDRLTGLLRRAYIDDALEREFARARRAQSSISFIVAEVDNYTRLESVYGPQGAENCLLGVADGLRYVMRRSSDALGRWSHTQLCILLSDTQASGALRVGERFRELIETLDVAVDPTRTVRLTVSIGIGTAQARGLADVKAVVAAAEQALEQASEAGGNRSVVVEPTSPMEDAS